MLRGQYAHNHRIQGNVLPTGGARKFRALGHDRSTIATWLQAAGYRTGLIGKYMNDYRPEQGYVPPGWDEWYAYSHGYYNYRSEEHTYELQSLMRISYAVFCLKKKNKINPEYR